MYKKLIEAKVRKYKKLLGPKTKNCKQLFLSKIGKEVEAISGQLQEIH